MPQTRTVPLTGGGHVTALHYAAAGEATATFVMAHGAGAPQTSPFMTGYAAGLASHGLHVLTFNFPYTERGRKLPDPQPVLEACFRSVLDDVATDPVLGPLPLFIGGKSMGGRMASHLAAGGDATHTSGAGWRPSLRGLVFFGYPLHPPARPQQVRVAHLPHITHPMLFVQGEKDAFGTPDELRRFLDVLGAPCTLYPVPHGDHSLEVTKRSGVDQRVLTATILVAVSEWIRSCV
jgi:hypothetical protein